MNDYRWEEYRESLQRICDEDDILQDQVVAFFLVKNEKKQLQQKYTQRNHMTTKRKHKYNNDFG